MRICYANEETLSNRTSIAVFSYPMDLNTLLELENPPIDSPNDIMFADPQVSSL